MYTPKILAAAPAAAEAAVSIDKVEHNRAEFERDTLELAARIRTATGSPSVALAPFAGTRIAGFRELNLDALVMVDWSRPGTNAEVRSALATPQFWKDQRAVSGGESSTDVIAYPATAQILAKLQLELGVTDVTVTRFSQRGDVPNVAHGLVDLKDRAFITRFDFSWNGKPRSIAFVSWAISGTGFAPGRQSMPNDVLEALSPEGYPWGYLAADGVGFFSRDPKNGLQRASRELLRSLKPGGAVILDDPNAAPYLAGDQSGSGMMFMRGRARLESYGVRQIGALEPPEHVYGYVGIDARDRVRIYQKDGHTAPSRRTAIDTSSFVRGESQRYMVAPR